MGQRAKAGPASQNGNEHLIELRQVVKAYRSAALDRETFTTLVAQSELTGEVVDEVMRERLDRLARKEEASDD